MSANSLLWVFKLLRLNCSCAVHGKYWLGACVWVFYYEGRLPDMHLLHPVILQVQVPINGFWKVDVMCVFQHRSRTWADWGRSSRPWRCPTSSNNTRWITSPQRPGVQQPTAAAKCRIHIWSHLLRKTRPHLWRLTVIKLVSSSHPAVVTAHTHHFNRLDGIFFTVRTKTIEVKWGQIVWSWGAFPALNIYFTLNILNSWGMNDELIGSRLFAGDWQLPALYPRPHRQGPGLDHRLREDHSASRGPDVKTRHSLARRQPGRRLPVGAAQSHPHTRGCRGRDWGGTGSAGRRRGRADWWSVKDWEAGGGSGVILRSRGCQDGRGQTGCCCTEQLSKSTDTKLTSCKMNRSESVGLF